MPEHRPGVDGGSQYMDGGVEPGRPPVKDSRDQEFLHYPAGVHGRDTAVPEETVHRLLGHWTPQFTHDLVNLVDTDLLRKSEDEGMCGHGSELEMTPCPEYQVGSLPELKQQMWLPLFTRSLAPGHVESPSERPQYVRPV